MIGDSLVGLPGVRLPNLYIPGLSDIPVPGPSVFQPGPDLLSLHCPCRRRFMVPVPHASRADAAIGRRQPCARPMRSAFHVLRYRYLAVMFGGACAGLAGGSPVAGLYAAMGGEHDRWTRLDCAGAGCFRVLAAAAVLAGAYIFGAVSIGQLARASLRHTVPVAIPVGSALSRDDRRPRDHISRNKRLTLMNTPACARPALRAGPLISKTNIANQTNRGTQPMKKIACTSADGDCRRHRLHRRRAGARKS